MPQPLGEILINRGVLSREQVEQLLDEQAETCRPFGVLAEERFGVAPAEVEHAWAEQYAASAIRIDPTRQTYDPRAMECVTRRQAWQFRILPIRYDRSELILATTQQDLPRAIRFGTNFIHQPCAFVICEPQQLDAALNEHFPMHGLTPELLAG